MCEHLNALTEKIIGAAIRVHSHLGPGLLESAYDACLAFEMLASGIAFERQKALPVTYRGHRVDCGYRMDFLVSGRVVLEIKAVERIEAVHRAQMLSYLRLTGCKVGLLINFSVKLLARDGVHRVVNDFPDLRTHNAPTAEHAE